MSVDVAPNPRTSGNVPYRVRHQPHLVRSLSMIFVSDRAKSHIMAEKDDSSPTSELSNLSISENLVPSIPKKQSQTVTLDFDGVLQPPLLLQTNESQCGGQLWPGGLVLAKFLLQHKTDVLPGKTMFVVRSDVSLRPLI